MSTAVELLSKLPLFQPLSASEREALAAILEECQFKKGEFIFEYGEPGESAYIVRSGEAEIFIEDNTGNRIVLEVVTPGKYFGELSLLDRGPRTASVIALEDLEAFRLDYKDLESFLLQNPKAAVHVLHVMGKRLRKDVEMLRQTASRNVNEEMATSPTTVQKVADWISGFSGSLPFLIMNAVLFLVWIVLNVNMIPGFKAFDPFPFGLLTMWVSLEAIFLSIFVLISQNRQAEKERIRADIEYDVNLKAELEIAHLHAKVDRLQAQLLAELAEIKKK
jgi:uncharacterized membrane protein